jgi:hypothetical protein
VEPLKNYTEGNQLAAYTKILKQVASRTKLKLYWMDNEALAVLKTLPTKDFQLEYPNLYPHIFIVAMQPNKPFAHSKFTSFPDCVWQTMIYQFAYGTRCYCRQK